MRAERTVASTSVRTSVHRTACTCGLLLYSRRQLYPICRRPRFVTCSKIASGRALLIGDASHAISPNIGMGCNSALQDAHALARSCIAASSTSRGAARCDAAAAASHYGTSRLAFAQMLPFVSARIDGFATIRYHGDTRRALRGFPYFLASEIANVPESYGIPGAYACCIMLLRPQLRCHGGMVPEAVAMHGASIGLARLAPAGYNLRGQNHGCEPDASSSGL